LHEETVTAAHGKSGVGDTLNVEPAMHAVQLPSDVAVGWTRPLPGAQLWI
jgi:hypothetical protein